MKRIRKLSPKVIRRLLSLIVMLGVCAILMPLPVARVRSGLPTKESTEPFPCQNRPCGCQSAEQCWKKCCCFNHSQKIAWAKANNVKVPAFVLAAAKREQGQTLGSDEVCSLPVVQETKVTQRANCCKHCNKKSTTVTQSNHLELQARKRRSSERKRSDAAEAVANSASKNARSNSRRSKWVMAVYSAECQGQGWTAFCLPMTLVPQTPEVQTPVEMTIETVAFESERLQQFSLRPPLPPPKIV